MIEIIEKTYPKGSKMSPEEKKIIDFIQEMGLDFKGQFDVKEDGKDITDIDAVFYDKVNKIYLFFEIKTGTGKNQSGQLRKLQKITTGDNLYKEPLKKKLGIKDCEHRRFFCLNTEKKNNENSHKNYIYKEDWEYLKNIKKVLGKLSYIHFYEFLDPNISLTGPNNIHARKIETKILSRKITAYICNVTLRDLFQSAFVFRKRDSRDKVEGFQRLLKNKKIKDISNTILDNDLYYGGLLTLNSTESIKKHKMVEDEILYPHQLMSVSVVDGQHRLYGYALAASNNKSLWKKVVPVIIFDSLRHEEETELFIKLNSTQSKVDPNLIYYHDSKNKIAQFFVRLNKKGDNHIQNNWFKNSINTGNLISKRGERRIYNLATLVSVVSKYSYFNQEGKNSVKLFKEIYKDIVDIFPEPMPKTFLASDRGIRILFKFVDYYYRERGRRISKQLLKKVKELFSNDKFVKSLDKLYGEGGAREASKIIFEKIGV